MFKQRGTGLIVALVLAACALTSCASGEKDPASRGKTPLVVYNAAAITRPMRAVLDSFAARTGFRYEQETAASLELARKVLDLDGQPDVLVLADPDIFPQLLEPGVTTWHALFARNRIVLAYTAKSRGASEVDSTNWFRVLSRPGVQVGRADPSGYRTLLVWQLAERHYKQPGLYQQMLAAAPARNVRPREADQVALLQANEYDYTWTYENLAELAGFRFVKLPDAVDLGNPADSATYATAVVKVPGRTAQDSVTFRGRPILFAVTIPHNARQGALAEQFVAFLLSVDGRRILKLHHFDALEQPVLVGKDHPTF